MPKKGRTPANRHKARKGSTATQGGTINTPMNFLGHFPNARKPKRTPRPQFSTPLSIAELWGNAALGEMTAMRAERRAKILGREKQSMADKAAYTQAKVRAAVA